MRLTQHQRQAIREQVTRVFGPNAIVYLFGSRTDDTRKGGDIDLYIEPDSAADLLRRRNQLISRLQMALGEQKIDLVIARNPDRLIEKEAKATGIRL